jgi:ComF family protein
VPHLDDCVATVAYAGDLPSWMQRFKYPRPGFAHADPAPVGVMNVLIAEATRLAVDFAGPPPDLVVPVPLHPRRLRARGFNPSVTLARTVARECGARFTADALARVRDTPTQTGLDRPARRRNVAGAFACSRAVRETVWLVDDVVTTGATLSECARVLRRNGAQRVIGVCVARTPKAHEREAPV